MNTDVKKSYNAKDCVITFDGVAITGVGEDMVSGEKDEDSFEPSVGAQGDVVISEVNNDLGTVTVTILTNSPQKAMLIDAYNNKTIAPLWVKNLSIGERFGGENARIIKPPTLDHGKTAASREVQFKVFDYRVENV